MQHDVGAIHTCERIAVDDRPAGWSRQRRSEQQCRLHPAGRSSSQTTADQGATGQSSVRIGRLVFTPGGFLDFENIFRTTNTQSNITSNFATIPFSNTPQGHVSEFRSTAQFSRLDLKIASKFGRHDVTTYIETDFSG